MNTDYQEKRINPRFECLGSRQTVVDIEEDRAQAQLTNLSRSGMSLRSSRTVVPQQTYQLNISDFKSEKRIPCEVRVVWVADQQENANCAFGARIVRMDPSEKMDLLDVLYEDWKREVLK